MPDNRPTVAVVGSINHNVIITTSRLPSPGETVVGTTITYSLGGKGANHAVAAARAGSSRISVAMIGAVGTDIERNQALMALNEASIGTEHVVQRADKPTGRAFIVIDEAGSSQIVVMPGANHTLTCTEVSTALDEPRPSVILITLEVPDGVIAAAFEAGEQPGPASA